MSRDPEKFLTDQNKALLAKGELLLEVTLNTVEDAAQILEWMYSPDKPMTATLESINWDGVVVTKGEGEVLERLKELYAP